MTHKHWDSEERDKSPCHDCEFFKLCMEKKLLCNSFIDFVNNGVALKPTKPTHKYYSRFLANQAGGESSKIKS